MPTTKAPGVHKADVNGLEIRKDGVWWMVIKYHGKSRRMDIIDQFKSKADAMTCAEEYVDN
jgi:predicted RNA-binding protein associated with RNAse of E/G family